MIILVDPPAAKADNPACCVQNRKHDAVPEAIVHTPIFTAHHESGVQHLLISIPLLPQEPQGVLPAVWRQPKTVSLNGFRCDFTARQIVLRVSIFFKTQIILVSQLTVQFIEAFFFSVSFTILSTAAVFWQNNMRPSC